MTAAVKSGSTMSVARGGGIEGMRIPISIGSPKVSRSPVLSFSKDKGRIKNIDTAYTGTVFNFTRRRNSPGSFEQKPNPTNSENKKFDLKYTVPYETGIKSVTDKALNKNEARNILKSREFITLYERPKTEKVKVSPFHVDQPAKIINTENSKKLHVTRTALAETISVPVQPQIIQEKKPSLQHIQQTEKTKPDTFQNTFKELKQKRIDLGIIKPQVTKQETSVAEVRGEKETLTIPQEKQIEKQLVIKYVNSFLLEKQTTNNERLSEPVKNKLSIKMAEYLQNPLNTKSESPIETQTMVLPKSQSREIIMRKIDEMVKKARVQYELEVLKIKDPALAEKKVLLNLHMAIQEAGFMTVFQTIKATILKEALKESLTEPEKFVDPKTAVSDQDNKKEQSNKEKTKLAGEVERDPYADFNRRWYLKMGAFFAFFAAKRHGKKEITEGQMVEFITTSQPRFIKSEPVRQTGRPDYTLVTTFQKLLKRNAKLESVSDANRVIDNVVDEEAPARLTPKAKYEKLTPYHLFKVLGFLDVTENMQNKKLQTSLRLN